MPTQNCYLETKTTVEKHNFENLKDPSDVHKNKLSALCCTWFFFTYCKEDGIFGSGRNKEGMEFRSNDERLK